MKRASLTRNAIVRKGRPVIKRNRIGIYLLRTLGAALAAFAISVFFTPNKIVNGGVSGVATMLYYTTGLSTGIGFAIINFALLAIGFKILGKEFVFRTIYVSGVLCYMNTTKTTSICAGGLCLYFESFIIIILNFFC